MPFEQVSDRVGSPAFNSPVPLSSDQNQQPINAKKNKDKKSGMNKIASSLKKTVTKKTSNLLKTDKKSKSTTIANQNTSAVKNQSSISSNCEETHSNQHKDTIVTPDSDPHKHKPTLGPSYGRPHTGYKHGDKRPVEKTEKLASTGLEQAFAQQAKMMTKDQSKNKNYGRTSQLPSITTSNSQQSHNSTSNSPKPHPRTSNSGLSAKMVNSTSSNLLNSELLVESQKSESLSTSKLPDSLRQTPVNKTDKSQKENSKIDKKISSTADKETPLKAFLQERTCYDLIPTSSKLVVFDTQLTVKKAFYALVANGLRAAPLWSQANQKFVGMLTITDFIMVLREFYLSDTDAIEFKGGQSSSATENSKKDYTIRMADFEEHTIQSWRELMNKQYSAFVSIDPNCSLFSGLYQLMKHKIHRLPVVDIDTGNPLYILTHKRILKFIKVCMDNVAKIEAVDKNQNEGKQSSNSSKLDISWDSYPLLKKTLKESKIGTYTTSKSKVLQIFEDQKIIEALNLFADFRISALPVIDRQTNRLTDVYSKFDVINLAAERSYHQLDVSIKQALSYRKRHGRGDRPLITCVLESTLSEICEKVVKAEVHRIIVVDSYANARVIGIVSLSDLLCAMVMNKNKL